ncbi:AbiH family protein [Pseudozobellia thermophila]|uniref:Bacteriophage abortive infection AbiH n=1 Tax=Pseudozobellia thermophila TaxID=192903 RepID=A0A1M6ANF2_9FLAO|nr:AbiH family protein [Pseudozobellia thermophila]SHI37927.1 Bacteriophage abortive infection AbiH [Pseudozobellia thermophila]
MNRLILIGNGFDLAHGFKTSYQDFVLDYFQKALREFYLSDKYQDELFELDYEDDFRSPSIKNRNVPSTMEEVKNVISEFASSDGMCKVNAIFHSAFFKAIYDSCSDLGWVDIENLYFEHLVSNKGKSSSLKQLNDDFEIITKKLESYLVSLKIENQNFNQSNFSLVFLNPIHRDEVVTENLKENLKYDEVPNNICILNFNYTPTMRKYMADLRMKLDFEKKGSTLQEIHIHGELGNEKNPIVFGFGDELDKEFLNFEDIKDDSLFTHIKSFMYSQTSNYHDLIRFIDADNFQVYIIGHSCGLSDRTMLNHIFEHEKCKSIKIFYHQRSDGTDDFTEKTYNIYRHFKDKGTMRLKLVPKDKSDPLPKPKR